MMTNHDAELTKDILRDISQAIYYRYSLTDAQVQNLILRHDTRLFFPSSLRISPSEEISNR
jgi:hypothetical protein